MKKNKIISLFLSIIIMLGIVVPGVFAANEAGILSGAAPYVLRSEATDKENAVKVWLELNPSLAESVASYQIALHLENVNSSAPIGRNMTLDFDESIQNAKIKATKYDKDTQTLRVYVADKDNLVKIENNKSANILPIGIINVEKTENASYNPFKIVLSGNDGEFAIADTGCNVKKAVDTYGEDLIIPVDGTVYGVIETPETPETTTEPTTEPITTPTTELTTEPTTTPTTEPTTTPTTESTTEMTTEDSGDIDHHCSCICHKSGLFGIIYKIFRFFWKIFSIHPVCDCGAAHY